MKTSFLDKALHSIPKHYRRPNDDVCIRMPAFPIVYQRLPQMEKVGFYTLKQPQPASDTDIIFYIKMLLRTVSYE